MFVDRIKVFAQAGNGGRGCVSFRREKFVPKGGPDGGDGGRGGDIVLKADSQVDNLTNLFYEPIIKAKNGGHGQGKKMHGRSAPNKIVKVPVGTLIFPADVDQNQRPARVVAAAVSGGRIVGPALGLPGEEGDQSPTPNAERATSNEEEKSAGAQAPAALFAGQFTIRNPQSAIEATPLADL